MIDEHRQSKPTSPKARKFKKKKDVCRKLVYKKKLNGDFKSQMYRQMIVLFEFIILTGCEMEHASGRNFPWFKTNEY